MNTYVVKKKPEVLDWAQIPEAKMEHMPWLEKADISASAQVCYDEENLYVRLTAREQEIRAEYTGLLDMPCQDSCLEFFFSPMPEDGRYFNVEYNPNGCVYLGFGTGRADHIRLLPDDRQLFAPCPARYEGGWEITYRIPKFFIQLFFPAFALESGKKMRANFYKCGDLTAQQHYLAWNFVTSQQPDFHRSCDFGELVLE